MLKKFIWLEWKAFIRSASMGANLGMKILMGFLVLYFSIIFLFLGIGVYYILEEASLDPVETVNQYLIYYLVFDLVMRFFFQNTPVMNIRPLLSLPLKRSTVIHYALGKTALSFFNWTHFFFLIPFSSVLLFEGYEFSEVAPWFIAVVSLIYLNNFINILLDKNDRFFYIFAGIFIALAGMQYLGWFDITTYTGPVFMTFITTVWAWAIVVALLILVYFQTYGFFRTNFYLDAGLTIKTELAKNQNLDFLDKYGTLGTFLKNDIKMLTRNKRSKTTLWMSGLFVLYGLLFISNSMYQGPYWIIFAGIFVTGGFLFTFGQFIPSWDSSYYSLMMTQNIQYKEYLNSKWWLMVIGTGISLVLASFYLFFGWKAYMAMVVGAIYNMGVNGHLVMLGGAFVKTPIDLTSSKQAFGDKRAFNLKTMLLSIPKIILPVALFAIGEITVDSWFGFALVALAGLSGFAFKGFVFNQIEKVYRTQKYDTIAAYKQKN